MSDKSVMWLAQINYFLIIKCSIKYLQDIYLFYLSYYIWDVCVAGPIPASCLVDCIVDDSTIF